MAPQDVSVVRLVERESMQIPIYFLSHVLRDAECRYTIVEMFGLALVMANMKLRPYLLAYSILVYTNQPLKQVLQNMEVVGRILKWDVELNMLNITFDQGKPSRDKPWQIYC